MAYTRGRKKVTWKDEVTRVPTKRPHPHVNEVPLSGHGVEAWEAACKPGMLWRTLSQTWRMNTYDPSYYMQHEIPYLTQAFYAGTNHGIIPIGTPAVYLGLTRVDEESRTGQRLSIPRHTFLIGTQRWLVADLNLLAPFSIGL